MTKRLTLVAALICAATFAMAQQMELGVRGGLTITNVRSTEVLDAVAPQFDDLIGFNATVFADIPVAGAFSVQPELTYNRKGFTFSEGTDVDLFGFPLPVGVEADTRFDYLEAPLLGKYRFGNDVVQGVIFAGPAFGYALDGSIKTRTSGLIDLELNSMDIDLDAINYNRFEVSGIVGAGLAFDTGAGHIQVDARYQHGFTELYDIPLVTEKVRNKGFTLSAGYSIPLGY